MKKRIAQIIAASALVAMTTVATISAAAAWYTGKATISTSDNITGSSQGAYFAGGNGTENSPFIITNKWHVYNLAWLTYIGWFDAADGWGQDKDVKQPYFILQGENDTIDMEGLVIPPIGTSTHPFKGNFDGNDNVIINFGVSNKLSSQANDGGITRKPTTVSSTLSNVEIVGFFGVVGIIPGYLDASYDSSINAIYDFGLDNFTVQTTNSQNGNLVGLAAGYVNADVSGVAVGSSNFDIASGTHVLSKTVEVVNSANVTPTYLSYYSTVGYCTAAYKNTAQVLDITAETPNVKSGSSSNSGNMFGASIPMQTIYNHLLSVKGTYNATTNYYRYATSENAYYESSSATTPTSTVETATTEFTGTYKPTSNSSYNYRFKKGKEYDSNGYEIASFNFMNRTTTDSFIYLDGERTISVSNATKYTYRYNKSNGTGYYIHDGKGHYLGISGTTLISTNEENAIPWIYGQTTNNNNTFYTLSTQVVSNNSATTYYLRSTGAGNLTLETMGNNLNATNRGYFTWSSGTTYFTHSSGAILAYVDGTWTTTTSLTATVYTINDGSVYLGNSGTTLTAVGSNSATEFKTNSNNQLYTNINGTTYYLYSSAVGSLTLSNSNSTAWTLNNGKFYNANRGYIVYDSDSNTWKTSTSLSGSETGYEISYNGTYFNVNGTSSITTGTSSNVLWHVDGNNRIYCTIGGTNYYVNYDRNLNSSVPRYPLMKDGNTLHDSDNWYIYLNNGSWNCSSSASQTQRTLTFNEVTISYDYTGMSASSSTSTIETKLTSTSAYTYASRTSSTASYKTYQTYFPLKYNDNYSDVAYNNTGYVVSGANYISSNTNIPNNNAGDFPGDIRVSKYSMSDLSVAFNSSNISSYDSGRFEIITKTAISAANADNNSTSGYVRISDGYNKNNSNVSSTISGYNKYDTKTIGLKKYTTARDYFHTTMSNAGSSVYGLHFMNAQISTSKLVTAERIMVNGWEYLPDGTANHYVVRTDDDGYPIDSNGNRTSNQSKFIYDKKESDTINVGRKYTLPQDSIDFNLSDNGTINFFAGTFFSGNTTFFSLHRIERNPATTQITSIKEIKKVYDNAAYHSVTNPNVPRYIFNYGTDQNPDYSVTLAAGTAVLGDLLFDTTWITTSVSPWVNNAAYYFEIPAIPGEYALGSVSGKTGAYLMYLDIGASDESNDIIIVDEVITTRTDFYIFPKGVDFVTLTTGQTTTYVETQGGDVGTVIIPDGVDGNNISFTLANKILTCGPPSTGSITQSTYIRDGVQIKCNGSNLSAVRSSYSTKIEEITTKWTFVTENDELYKDVTTVTTIDGGASETHVADQTVQSGITQEIYEGTMKIKIMEGSTDTYVEFWYEVPQGSTVTIEYLYTYNPSTNEYTYVFTVTCEDAPVVIHVTSIATGYNVTFKGVNEAGTDYESQAASAGGTYTIRAGTVTPAQSGS